MGKVDLLRPAVDLSRVEGPLAILIYEPNR
jgi:hypothetical protein